MNKHYILHDHHNNNPTIVIGEICCNGCQVFHKDDANEVFKEFDVSEQHQKDVMELFDKYNPNVGFDFESFINDPIFVVVKHKSPQMMLNMNITGFISSIIKYYHTDDDNLSEILFNSTFDDIKLAGVKVYTKEQLDTLVNHKFQWGRIAIAIRGYKEHLDILVHDESDWVRAEVAKHGHKDHLDILVDDESHIVRVEVARCGYRLDKLVNDPTWVVRKIVACWDDKKYLDILVDDCSFEVRAFVACHGFKEHLYKLKNDRSSVVLLAVVEHADIKLLEILAKHEWIEVSRAAKKRLANM